MKWKKVKLKDMAGINGVFKDGDWVESKDQDPNGDVRLIQMADIGERVYKDKSQRFMTSESFDKLNCTEIIKGDILISRMPDPIGRACIFEGDDKKCATVVDICIIRVDQEIVNSRWLMHRINFIDIRTQIEMKATGTTRKRIARSKLGELEIPLPPMDIQIKIASVLDKAQELIDSRKVQIEKYDELLQSVFLDMFGDPMTNPKGWGMEILENLVSKLGDGLHGTPEYSDGNYYFINGNNLNNGNILIDSKTKTVSKEEYEKHKRDLNEETMFVSINGTIGKVSFYKGEPIILGKSACYFNLKKGLINKLYLYSIIRSHYFINYAQKCATGSTIKNVSLKSMRMFPIPQPPLSLQNKFAEIVEKVESEKKIQVESLKQLEDNFNSIMQRAFKGELF